MSPNIRTVEKEIKAMGLTWGEAEMVALDRISVRQRVEASCFTRSLEQEEEDVWKFEQLGQWNLLINSVNFRGLLGLPGYPIRPHPINRINPISIKKKLPLTKNMSIKPNKKKYVTPLDGFTIWYHELFYWFENSNFSGKI